MRLAGRKFGSGQSLVGSPALKYDEKLVGSIAMDPHYMSKDEA